MAVALRNRLGGAPELRDVRPFRALWQANALSLTGNEGYEITLLLLTTAAFGSVLSVDWLGVVMTLPAIVASPLVGAWLDRSSQLRGVAMRLADVVRAVLAVGFAFLLVSIPDQPVPLYLVAASITVLDVVFNTGLRASVPRLIPADDPQRSKRLTAANSMLMSQVTAAQVVGPPVFVFLLQWISPTTVVLIDAATFIASYLLLRTYAAAVAARPGGDGSKAVAVEDPEPAGTEPAEETAAAGAPADAAEGYLRLLREGLTVVLRDDLARRILVTYMVTGGFGFALLLSVPALAESRQLPSWTVGVSLGALAGAAFVGARLARRDWFARRPVPVLVIDPVFRAGCFLAIAFLGGAETVVVAFFIVGVSAGIANVSRVTMFQSRFDDAVLARVMSLYFLASQVLTPVTPFLWLALARVRGISASYVGVAALFALASLVMVTSRTTRREWSAA